MTIFVEISQMGDATNTVSKVYYKPGTKIRIRPEAEEPFEAEVIMHCHVIEFLLIKCPAKSNKPNLVDVFWYKQKYVEQIEVLQEPDHIEPLQNLSVQKMQDRMEKNKIRRKRELEQVCNGATWDAHCLFNHLAKGFPEDKAVCWEQQTRSIHIMNCVEVAAPYGIGNVTILNHSKNDEHLAQMTNERVRKMVQSFYDNASLRQPS